MLRNIRKKFINFQVSFEEKMRKFSETFNNKTREKIFENYFQISNKLFIKFLKKSKSMSKVSRRCYEN